MKIRIFLIFILSLAFTLRIWALNIVPSGFTPDEASFGYDAYSILKTGKDQWGRVLPLTLESFGDYKLPVYTYLTIPSVAVFGLNKFAVRLPNAVIGTLAVLVTYLLVREMQRYRVTKKNNGSRFTDHGSLPMIGALLLAISPWHIMMSRGAFEANLTTFFLPLGVYLFYKGINEKRYLSFAAVIFGINLFTYHSARFVTPLIVLALVLIYKDDLKAKFESNVKNMVPLFIFSTFLFLAFITIFQGGARRAKDITILTGAVNEASESRFIAIYEGMSEQTARFFHNKYQIIARRFFNNYTQYFSSNFLFINGPAEGTYGMVPGRGVIYLFELPLLMGFLYSLFKSKDRKGSLLILVWVLLAPIPAALTQGRGYAGNRSEIMLPALTIMSAIGFVTLKDLFGKSKLFGYQRSWSSILFMLICLLSFISFIEGYFILSPYKNAEAMLYGNLEVADWLTKNSESAKQIIVSKSISEPHIYIAFAGKWNPVDYQKETVDWVRYKEQNLSFLDQLDRYSLGKFKFESIDYKTYKNQKDILLVGKPTEFSPDVKTIAKFLRPDGTIAVIVVEPFNQAYADANSANANYAAKNN